MRSEKKRIALEDSEKQLVRHFSEMTGEAKKGSTFSTGEELLSVQEKRLQEMERSLQETDEALTTQQKRLSELEHAISEGAETDSFLRRRQQHGGFGNAGGTSARKTGRNGKAENSEMRLILFSP